MTTYYSSFGASIAKRDPNQDAYFAYPTQGMFGVFDGVGGSPNSQNASKEAVGIFFEAAKEFHSLERDKDLVGPWLCQKMIEAHDKILRMSGATTASVMVICEDVVESSIVILNVGDSRVYGFNKEKQLLKQLTIDDTGFGVGPEVAKRLDEIEKAEDVTNSLEMPFRFRNVIGKALGEGSILPLRPVAFPLNDFDSFLLTTDGVHDNLSVREILNILLDPNLKNTEIADEVVEAALARSEDLQHVRSKRDDITAVYVTIERA